MLTVIELQTNNGTTSVLTNSYAEESLAWQKYYQVLSFAAVSDIDIHSAAVINEEGFSIKNETFNRVFGKDVIESN